MSRRKGQVKALGVNIREAQEKLTVFLFKAKASTGAYHHPLGILLYNYPSVIIDLCIYVIRVE
jgi:hypothetical protein